MADQKMDDMQMAAIDLLTRFKGMGFVLVVVPLGAPGVNQYISNVQSRAAITILRNAAFGMEQNMVPPAKPLNGNG